MDEFFPYKDIIDLPHHQSEGRGHMTMYDRAAQFSPYAALVGYDEIIAEAGRLTEEKPELLDHIRDRLDRRFMLLSAMLGEGYRPEVTVTYFVPDKFKDGGKLESYTGKVRKIDSVYRTLIFFDKEREISGKVIGIDSIISAESELFDEIE